MHFYFTGYSLNEFKIHKSHSTDFFTFKSFIHYFILKFVNKRCYAQQENTVLSSHVEHFWWHFSVFLLIYMAHLTY